MPDIPAPLTYGTVVGHFTSILWDTADAGNAPDISDLSGTVTISPNVRVFRILGPTNYIAIQQNIVAKIVAGVLLAPDGVTPLRIIASDSPGITPSPVQYVAQFALDNASAQPGNLVFQVPSNGTVDLATIVSLAPASAVQTIVSDDTRIAAEAAAAQAQAAADQLQQMINNGSIAVNGREVSLSSNSTSLLWRLGTDPYQTLIPLSQITGPAGAAGTITGVTVTGLASGATPTVTLGGTASARTIALGIPAGPAGTAAPVDYTAIYNGIGYVQIPLSGSTFPDRSTTLTARGIDPLRFTGYVEWYSVGTAGAAAPGSAVVGDVWWEDSP